ncbi:MAG: L,D-transpeptidase family protein [Caulobacter sp.]|nr:L,D-transpeptidase family protein [Caulobacter sp.]
MRQDRFARAVRPLGRIALAAVLAASVSAAVGPAGSAVPPDVAAPVAVPECPPIAFTLEERGLILETLLAADDPAAGLEALEDAALMAVLRRHAIRQLGLRIRPSAIDRIWTLEPPLRDVDVELNNARRDGRFAAWLQALEPPHAGYRALAAERRRYRTIIDGGGWLPLSPGPTFTEGAEDARIEAVRARLTAEGYSLLPTETPARFDADLATALRTFQRRHDLDEDGVLGTETRRALDIPAEERLAQIDVNLERWRWLPRQLPPDRLELDTGAAEAVRYTTGAPTLTMRVIVGSPRHKTPMFASALDAVVLNPPWNVPASIARNEILPRAAREPGYLSRNGYVRTANGLQQRPGPGNALGFLKFDLPSPFGVYLHDTPGRSSFARRVRTLSHGCMRLEKPRELAEDLLAPQGWTRADIDRVIDARATRRIALQKTLPLFVIYRTVGLDEAGRAIFRPDPYRWDARLQTALSEADRRPPPPRRCIAPVAVPVPLPTP